MGTVTQNHIEIRVTRGGEKKPYIAGTRVSVQDIYVWHELRGSTPDEIVANYPHLTLAQVHAALTYYFDHADEVREQLKAECDFADSLEALQQPTRFSKLSDKLTSDKEAHDDSLPSG